MQVTFVGHNKVDFTNDKGERIVGNNIFVNYPDPDVIGQFAGKIFVRPDIEIPQGIKVNEIIEMSFTPKGKLTKIAKV